MSMVDFHIAYSELEKFLQGLSTEQRKAFEDEYGDEYRNLLVINAIANDDHRSFDANFYQLKREYKYSADLIKPVSNYLEQRLPIQRIGYIREAYEFHKMRPGKLPRFLEDLYLNMDDEKNAAEIKHSLMLLPQLPNQIIPRALPGRISNNRSRLDQFILSQLIDALKQFVEKIQSIEHTYNPVEDNYSEALVSILNPRVSFWGWHTGVGLSGRSSYKSEAEPERKESGRLDIGFVDMNNKVIGIVESLMLSGKETNEVEEHVLKCLDYEVNLDSYIVLGLYREEGKPRTTFDSTWKAYKKTVLDLTFPAGQSIVEEVEDISHWFENVSQIKISTTIHKSGKTFYHVLANLGTKAPKKTKP